MVPLGLKCVFLATLAAYLGAAPLLPAQQALLARGHRHEKAGWIYVHVEGSPRERGFQQGYLLAREIEGGLRAFRLQWEYKTGADWSYLLEHAAKAMIPRIDAEVMAELDGMAEGLAAAGIRADRVTLTAYNAFSEVLDYWWPYEKDRLKGEKTPHKVPESCSAFIATGSWTSDGSVVLGHNTHAGYQDPQQNIVLDLVPEKGHRILMQSVPGWVHSGPDFFLTDAGLVGAETTIGEFTAYDPDGIPEFARMRRATQDASDLDAWCALMKQGNTGGYANAWLLGDTRTGEVARLELGLKYIGFERTRDGFFTGSNLAENVKLLRWETTSKETDISQSSVARRVRWKQLMARNKGRIDVELAKAFEADHYDAKDKQDRLGGRALCGHYELDPEPLWGVPFNPSGCLDAKVVDTRMARRMSFAGRYGAACGRAFDAAAFLEEHPQFDWLTPILPSRPSLPWVEFTAGETR
jgi:hypothetical protein